MLWFQDPLLIASFLFPGVYKVAEEDAIQKLSANIKDLQERTYRAPLGTVACQLEREATLQCYTDNAKNPLACASFVSAFEKCANNVRAEAIRRKALSLDQN